MNKKDLLSSMNDVAERLETIGFIKEAKFVTDEMVKLAQFFPTNNPAPTTPAPYSLPTGSTPTVTPPKPSVPTSGSTVNQSAIFGGFNKTVQSLNKLWQSLESIANGQGDPALANLTFNESDITAPLELIKIRQDSNSKNILSQYEADIRNNSQALGSLILKISSMQRSNTKQAVSAFVKQQLPKIQTLIQSLIGQSEMISKRLSSGQFTDNTALFQKYIDWGQGKTVRQVYDHALQNNSANFANNLAATLKANGLNDQNSVIPPGFKL